MFKKKIMLAMMVLGISTMGITGCSLEEGLSSMGLMEQTCKEGGCDETNIYEDGYCEYHYLMHSAESVLKSFVNN